MKRIVLAVVLSASLPVLAASGSAEVGERKSAPCAACHGKDGISVSPEFPNLAGQNEDYIVAALRHYKNGKRKNPIMSQQVDKLGERDILDLAAYFSSRKGLYVKE